MRFKFWKKPDVRKHPRFLQQTWLEKHQVACAWDEVAPDVETLSIGGTIKDFTPLLNLSKLVELRVMHATPERLAIIGQLTKLRSLWIDCFRKVSDVEPLANLTNLETLIIEGNMNGFSLNPIGELTELRALYLRALVSTAVNGGHVVVESFSPLAKLANLEFLDIFAVRPADGTLEPLTHLRSLEEIDMMNDFPVREMARLAALLPNTWGKFQQPFFKIKCEGELACKSCGGSDCTVMIGIGNRARRRLCTRCHTNKIAEYVAEYESLKSEFSNGGK